MLTRLTTVATLHHTHGVVMNEARQISDAFYFSKEYKLQTVCNFVQ